MTLKQRDVVEINFYHSGFGFKPHPAIIVSNDELNENEDFFYVVLISSKNTFPEYSYPLTDEMTTNKFQKKSYVKCQIITSEKNVIQKLGTMKKNYFDEMVEKIIDSIF